MVTHGQANEDIWIDRRGNMHKNMGEIESRRLMERLKVIHGGTDEDTWTRSWGHMDRHMGIPRGPDGDTKTDIWGPPDRRRHMVRHVGKHR